MKSWVVVCALVSTQAFGCWCFPVPMCSDVTRNSISGAIFTGRVISVWPPLHVIRRDGQERSLPALKRRLLERWRSVLTADEKRHIRMARDRSELDVRYSSMQRVRFAGRENLFGPEVREVYTDVSSCGYQFKTGGNYLVDSYREDRWGQTNRYRTGACSRTGPTESDDVREDMLALRAYGAGVPLRPRIYGRIPGDQLARGIRARLSAYEVDRSVEIGGDGRFSFDDLDPRVYRLDIADERGHGDVAIDLAKVGCFEATPTLHRGAWSIQGSPVVLEAFGRTPRLDPAPPLPPQDLPALPAFLNRFRPRILEPCLPPQGR